MTRTEAPKERAGRGWVNFARTTPELPGKGQLANSLERRRPDISWYLPCGRVTLPQITRILVPRISFCPR